MSNVSIKTTFNHTTKDEDAHENDAPFETREEIVSKVNELHIDQAPTEADALKTLIYKDLGLHLSDAVKNNINSDEPIRVINFDYGYARPRNIQWVQYSKPEMVPERQSLGFSLPKVFGLVFLAVLLMGLSGAAVLLVPGLTEGIYTVIGLGSFCGSMFLFLMTIFIMLSPCSIYFPCNMICYLFLVTAASIHTVFITAHSGGTEILVTIAVIGSIIFLFFIMGCTAVNFMKPYLFVLSVTLALGFYTGYIFAVSYLLKMKIVVIYTFLGLLFTIFYLNCVVLQVQMLLGGKGIEGKGSSIYGASTVLISIIFVFVNILKVLHQHNLI